MGKVLAGGYRANKMTRFVVSLLAAMLGTFAAGCLQGAQALPLDGPGYEAIRISRNRYWGQPVTIDFVKRFSEQVRAAGQAPLYIGDIGQPRGGPMSFGHASHQVGLDVDIWFERQPGARLAPIASSPTSGSSSASARPLPATAPG